MESHRFIFSFIISCLLLIACDNDHKFSSKKDAVIFSKPALVIIQFDSISHRIQDPKILQPFIIKANELSLEIAIVPPRKLSFKLNNGEFFNVDASLLNDGQLIFFNGTEVLITTKNIATVESFNNFFRLLIKELEGNELKTDSKESQKMTPGNSTNQGAKQSRTVNKKSTKYKTIQSQSKEDNEFDILNQHSYIYSVIKRNSLNNKVTLDEIRSDNYSIEPLIIRNPVLNSYIWPFIKFQISLDNDLFDNSDRYYTNGVHLKYNSPAFAFWQINSVLPISIRNSMEYNSLEIHHGMYTPYTTKSPPLLKNDRPYASTLYLKYARMSTNHLSGLIQSASIDIGVIGEAALGSLLQKGVHSTLPTNDEPIGWETQISNDLILNYNYEVIKHIATAGALHTFSIASASLGTLNTSVTTGIGMRIGNEYFISPWSGSFDELEKLNKRKLEIKFEANGSTTIVGYNALLSGGLLNKHNIFVLKPEEIERLVFNAKGSILLSYSMFGLKLSQNFISNEFKEGKRHFWGQIEISVGL